MKNLERLPAVRAALPVLLVAAGCGGDSALAVNVPDTDTTYRITVPQGDHRVAIVTASLVPIDREFYMFPGAYQFPARWATFVSEFEVVDESGAAVPFTAHDDGTWQLSALPRGRVTVSYRVNLDHEDHSWNGGVDGAAYWREWGAFYTTRSLFVVNGGKRDSISVEFHLPDQWQVTVPWEAVDGDATRYVVPNYEVLATSMLFAGTHREVVVEYGDFELLLALGGEDIIAEEAVFVDMAGGVLDYYVDLMGGTPRFGSAAGRNLSVVIINQADMTDGEAVGNNISILLDPAGDPMSESIARLIFAHEFFHLWNGKSFVPDGQDTEWFKEGFSNYYTLKALRHIDYLSDDAYLGLLADFFYQRYDSDEGVGRLSMTDGELKHEHWGLIYGGGMLVAIAQDLQIRAATGNDASLDDLMRFMFDEYGDRPYDIADIERALGELNGVSQSTFLDRYVRGVERIPISEYLRLAGIEAIREDGKTVFRVRDDPDRTTSGIRRGMFGNHPGKP